MTNPATDVYSVGQIAAYLREALEVDPLLSDLWVSGEMSNVTRSSAGHLYFTLKDASGQLRCVMFRGALNSQADAVADPGAIKDGAAVVVHGRLSFYEVRGDLQVIADVLMPQGVGALFLEFQRLKAKLEAEGLFDLSRKRPLPEFPQRIALITSPTGAVLHDIVTIVERRYPLVELLLTPVAVQGDSAAPAIVDAFARLNRRSDIDAIILARGGGSIEELWPFNEEKVARAIYASRLPVISAVGHETDFTIADYVADLRAPTPSAAAELAVPDQWELRGHISGWSMRLNGITQGTLLTLGSDLQMAAQRLKHRGPEVQRERQKVDDLTRVTGIHLRTALFAAHAQIEQRLVALDSLNPQRTLERGYAIVQQESGKVVSRAGQVQQGDGLTVRVQDGSFPAVAGDGGTPSPRPRRQTRRMPQTQLALFSPPQP